MTESLACVIAGGGPAGVFAGLLLARAGVRVTVLEKHADFLRDFRGDTVHASTLALLDQLELGEDFRRLPHWDVDRLEMDLDDGPALLADYRHLPGRYQRISFIPQADLLNLLSGAAKKWPWFTLRMGVEAVDLIWDGERVAGVVAQGPDGRQEIRARLTVLADGRRSVLRQRAQLPLRDFDAPIDFIYFQRPLRESDTHNFTGRFSRGAIAILVRRETHWQCALMIGKGHAEELLADDAAPVRARFEWLAPWLADRMATLTAADISVLDVHLNRLRRWWRPGLIAIGDAAHAMSPVGGVGINLAVQDAVALVNKVATPLREGRDVDSLLRKVQRRRVPPTVITQRIQKAIHKTLLTGILPEVGVVARSPFAYRMGRRFPRIARITARFDAVGFLPEKIRTPAVPVPDPPLTAENV